MYISCLLFVSSYYFFCFVSPTEVISAILFPIKFPVISGVFWTTLLKAVFAASISIYVAMSMNFLLYLSPNFLGNDQMTKNLYPLTYFLYFGSVEYLIFIIFTQLLVSY